jgi:hypothetical protein
MKMDTLMPFLTGLAGALIGAGASIVTVIIQSKREEAREAARLDAERRRSMNQLAIQAGLEEYKQSHDLQWKLPGASKVFNPLLVFVYYNAKLMSLVDAGQLTPDKIRALNQEIKDLDKVAYESESGFRTER